MAREIEFNWDSVGNQHSKKYPWTKWMNGQTWEVVRGTDYRAQSESFRQTLHKKARGMDRRVRTTIVKSTDGKKESVRFQFYDKPSRASGSASKKSRRKH